MSNKQNIMRARVLQGLALLGSVAALWLAYWLGLRQVGSTEAHSAVYVDGTPTLASVVRSQHNVWFVIFGDSTYAYATDPQMVWEVGDKLSVVAGSAFDFGEYGVPMNAAGTEPFADWHPRPVHTYSKRDSVFEFHDLNDRKVRVVRRQE